MTWSDEEIDELLTSYLDQKLPPDDAARVERLLIERPELERKLADWQANRSLLRSISPRKTLGADFAARVLSAAGRRVSESNDPELAPWIPRLEPSAPILEPAGKVSERFATEPVSNPADVSGRTWFSVAVAVASAACLLFAAAWLLPTRPVPQFVAEKNSAPVDGSSSNPRANATIVLDDKSSTNLPPIESITKPDTPQVEKPLVVDNSMRNADDRNILSEPTMPSPAPNNLVEKSPAAPGTTTVDPRVMESTVAPSLQPTPEQLRMLEAMSPTATGAFVMVIDVSLPPGIADLESLQSVLNRHDIPWSSQIDIDDETRTSLVDSRMISQAAKQGFLPEDARKETGDASQVKNGESVSLVFVKGRGSRLDKALIELMRRIEEFPEFSFDLAFDPPIQSLVDELRFVQEANLPSPTPQVQDAAGVVRVKTETEAGTWGSVFSAAPRRAPVMQHDVRKQSAELGTASIMNPVAYALIIVRHSKN